MVQRIKTSSKTSINLDKIQNKLHLSSKAAILRICLSLSLNIADSPLDYYPKDTNNGFDISLATLYGEYETLYKALIIEHEQKVLSDEEYISLIVSHIERGMVILYGEFATTNSTEEMVKRLVDELK